MSDRKIGRVISVDSFRLVVQLDSDLKSLYKSGFEDIYEIARINSYLIIPVGADRIVALITRVKIQDETEIEKTSGSITLPRAERYLVATMIGTIENRDNEFNYIQGVYNFPILDNPVWYVTKDDLDRIFDTEKKDIIDLDKDFYLPIGTSPAFSNYKIRINPDKFFGKHAAILGNTGSGKSCTVTSVLQSLFNHSYKIESGKKLQNAHIIIFDTNGEYKDAFIGSKENPYQNFSSVNTLHIDESVLQIPYWFMNYDDMEFLFEPSGGTQAPILKRALGLSKDQTAAETQNTIPRIYISWIQSVINLCYDIDNFWKMGNKKINDHITKLRAYEIEDFDITNILTHLSTINGLVPPPRNYDIPDLDQLKSSVEGLEDELNKYQVVVNQKRVSEEKNIDLPIYFNYKELISKRIDDAIDELEGSKGKITEYISTLRLRLQSFLNDERIAKPLMLRDQENFNNALALFISFIIGDLFKVFIDEEHKDIYTEYFKSKCSEANESMSLEKSKPSQITIIDMSLIPFEVLETITGLIGRLILEFLSRFNPSDRGAYPVVLVLEEAQNYIPEMNKNDKTSISKKIFERIAREGRKYGLSLIVSSQRPSELSKTVLSQCNSFIIHRLQNPEDQKYVRQLVSAANEDILQQLPILPQQHAIIMGDAVRSPIQLKINNANPKPNSDNPKFISKWLEEARKEFPDYKKIAKDWEEGKKISE